MAVDQDLLERMDQREMRVQGMTPEECVAASSLLRDTKPRLGSDRQRELADGLAAEFEARAARNARAAS